MIETNRYVQSALSESVPSWLTQGSCALSFARRCWRALCAGRIYSHSENWLGLTFGIGLEASSVGNTNLIRFGALIATVGARTAESGEHYKNLKDRCSAIKHIWLGHGRLPPFVPWPIAQNEGLLVSPSTSARWCRDFLHFKNHSEQIAWECYQLAWTLLSLVNTIAEIADAVSWEPEAHRRNVREVFVNIDTAVEQLATNGPLLVKYLRTHRPIVESILEVAGSPIDPDTFISAMAKATGAAETIVEHTSPYKKKYSAAILETAKMGITGAAASFGYLDSLPDSLFPESLQPAKNKVRHLPYPPIDLISRISQQKIVDKNKTPPKPVLKSPPRPSMFDGPSSNRAWSKASTKRSLFSNIITKIS